MIEFQSYLTGHVSLDETACWSSVRQTFGSFEWLRKKMWSKVITWQPSVLIWEFLNLDTKPVDASRERALYIPAQWCDQWGPWESKQDQWGYIINEYSLCVFPHMQWSDPGARLCYRLCYRCLQFCFYAMRCSLQSVQQKKHTNHAFLSICEETAVWMGLMWTICV